MGKLDKNADITLDTDCANFSGKKEKTFPKGFASKIIPTTTPKESKNPALKSCKGWINKTKVQATPKELKGSYLLPLTLPKSATAHIITALIEDAEKPQTPA